MSEERRSRRERIVHRLYNEGWVPGGFDVVFELLDPDVEWTAIEGAPDAGTYRGHEGVRAYMQDWLDEFDFGDEENRIEESVEVGDRLVCVQRAGGTGRASGVRSEIHYACVYTFGDDERIVTVNEYATREEALDGASRATATPREPENVEVVRRTYQAFNDRDLDALLASFADDVEWRLIGGFADLMGAEFKGHEALRGFFDEWLENLGGQVEMETALEADDRVVVVVRTVGAGGASGAPAELRWGQVLSFRGGQVSAVDNYYEASDALAAVGLGESATSQKVDTVRAMYDAAGRRDLDGAVQCLHPDVELRPAIESLELGGLIHGREGVREFWELLGDWDSLRVEFKETIEAGDRLLVHEHWHVSGREGMELDFEISDLFTFRDGLVLRVDGFADKAEALAALG